MAVKPLDKITISDIADDAEITRQTFYYHFGNIYDLVEWTYTHEAEEALAGMRTYDTWQDGFLRIFQYALDNEGFVKSTYHSMGREHLEAFLYRVTYDLLLGVIEEKAHGMQVRDEDKAFIADFYKYGFVGIVLDWVGNGMIERPERIIGRLDIVVHNSVPEALERFRTDHPSSLR